MRILITPQPRSSYGPGIFLGRVAKELRRRGYTWTAKPFHYLGLSIPAWDYALVMGCPRHLDKVISRNKPMVVTMGKPESRQEHQAVGKQYPPECDQQKERMADAILRGSKIVFISHYVCQIWREYFVSKNLSFPNEKHVRVIHNGLASNHFCPAKPPPAKPGKVPFVMGMVGSIRNEYRLKTFFDTSCQLEFDHGLLIVGSMSKQCKDLYAEVMLNRNLASRTTYLPWVEPEKLVDCYRRMHCLFHPVDYEGCGIVPTEALACGVPVAVPAHGAPKEYLLSDAGIAVETEMFNYDDEFCRRMATAVTQVRENWTDFAHGARQAAVLNLSIEKTLDSYLDFMELPRYL